MQAAKISFQSFPNKGQLRNQFKAFIVDSIPTLAYTPIYWVCCLRPNTLRKSQFEGAKVNKIPPT